tara:strand:+ start:314 stop:640 length:327 start_codon:yes stop_codon:yes gene_type:complete
MKNSKITIGNWTITNQGAFHTSENGSKYSIKNNNIFEIINGHYDWMLHLAARNPFTEKDVLDFNEVLLYHAKFNPLKFCQEIFHESVNMQNKVLKVSKNLHSRNSRLI